MWLQNTGPKAKGTSWLTVNGLSATTHVALQTRFFLALLKYVCLVWLCESKTKEKRKKKEIALLFSLVEVKIHKYIILWC